MLHCSQSWTQAAAPHPALAKAIAEINANYLTPEAQFGNVGRGNPVPDTLPPDKLRAAGLTRDTWQLEVLADPQRNSVLDRPLTKERGAALNWDNLMKLAEKRAVRYLKVITCNNVDKPFGIGLWEGVPLRDVIWLAKPKENIRHVYYYGYHNDDPKQIFRCWLPINRVLEDPPGELPVLLCYKMNGQWLTPKRGGPVRMVVPEAYAFKSVKWLQRIVLTNEHRSDDTYASGNNDTNSSWLKTFARFISVPAQARAGQPIPITGMAQVGISGLAKVQFWLHPQNDPLPPDDPYFTHADWNDAQILPLPDNWHRQLPDGRMPEIPLQFDPVSGKPRHWPLRYTIAHWAALLTNVPAGRYEVRCRTIDEAGYAQPMPRPFAKSGRNALHSVPLTVEPA
jgi:hypothetical protein